jgi:hypothetical protein
MTEEELNATAYMIETTDEFSSIINGEKVHRVVKGREGTSL